MIQLDPTTPVVWGATGQPPGASSPTLGATYPSGYAFSYQYSYEVNGYMYTDPYRDTWFNTYLQTDQQNSVYTFVPQNVKDYWTYGTPGVPQIAVNGRGLPKAITYNWFSTNWTAGHYPDPFVWAINITINVSNECTQDNIHSQTCIDICNLNPTSQTCYFAYSQYCLKEAASQFGDPVCVDYFTRYVAANNSNADIDNQAIAYCKKYTGFEDLLESSSAHPDAQRVKDVPVCACYLSSQTQTDPTATVLYDAYRADLEKSIPVYADASIKTKCLVPACASASILPSNIPAKSGGCPVPKCINSVVINNDGTIDKIDVAQGCGGDGNEDYLLIAIFVALIVLILIIACLYFSTAPAKPQQWPLPHGSGNLTSGDNKARL